MSATATIRRAVSAGIIETEAFGGMVSAECRDPVTNRIVTVESTYTDAEIKPIALFLASQPDDLYNADDILTEAQRSALSAAISHRLDAQCSGENEAEPLPLYAFWRQ